jgi:hypothetical protein
MPGGRSLGFTADRAGLAFGMENNTGRPTQHILVLDHASGIAETVGHMIYGPFEVPDGAYQSVVLHQWPQVKEGKAALVVNKDYSLATMQVYQAGVPGICAFPLRYLFAAHPVTRLGQIAIESVALFIRPQHHERLNHCSQVS